MLVQSKVIGICRNLSNAGQFHHLLIFGTFVVAYSKVELKRNRDKFVLLHALWAGLRDTSRLVSVKLWL